MCSVLSLQWSIQTRLPHFMMLSPRYLNTADVMNIHIASPLLLFFSLSFVAITWLFSPTGGLPTLFHSFLLKRLFFWCSFHSFVNLIFAFFINRLAWWPRVFHYVILFWNATRWCSYWIHVCFAFDFILCSTDFSLYLSIASTSLTSAE